MDFELRLLLSIFTCYRLAQMVAKDDGPFFLFKRVRYWAKDRAWREADAGTMIVQGIKVNGVRLADDEISDRWFGHWHNLAEGLSCPYCTGVWLSLPVLVLVLWPTYYGDLFLVLMAVSGGQAFLQSLGKE